MTVVISSLYFAPNGVVGNTLTADLILLTKEIDALLAGTTDEKKTRVKLNPILKRLNANQNRKTEVQKIVFSLANRVYLSGRGAMAEYLIAAVHKRADGPRQAVLQQNFNYAKKMLEGMPYDHGYITYEGQIKTKGSKLGLNCITMNNIMINLTVGARNYSEKLAGDPSKKRETNEDIFTKQELIAEGVYSFPVITGYKGDKLKRLDGLLNMYGDYFAAQLYLPDGLPFHTIYIYREGSKYRVMDTLGNGHSFRDIGDLASLGKRYGNQASYNINLVDAENPRPVQNSKTKTFLTNLQRSIEEAKRQAK
jgi:hypothetical protein